MECDDGIATSLSAPLNHGLVADIERGLSVGRFAVATVEAGILYALGVTQALKLPA